MIEIIMRQNLFSSSNFPKIARRSYSKDNQIFVQGGKAKGVLYVFKGSVKLTRHTSSGNVVPIHTAKVGETVAEASLFSSTYHCDCVALEECIVGLIEKQVLLKLLESDVELNREFMCHLAEQTISYRRRIELLTTKSARGKVIAALADNVAYSSILDLASYLGLTHEATYRALSELTDMGRLRKTGRGKYEVANASKQRN